MRRWRKLFLPVVVFAFITLCNSCKTLKPHERVYVNDPDMQMGDSKVSGFEKYVHSIREGATPAGGPKTSGGCGCN